LVLQITPYQRAVLQLLADGRDGVEIAGRLRISERQYQAGLSRLMATMGARSAPEAVDVAIRRGIVAHDYAREAGVRPTSCNDRARQTTYESRRSA
jgi:DNA-binding CsgD family transcriptional regulator